MVKPYSPHPPSKKQRSFLELDAEEAFYGGAAGGGKSDGLILGALQHVDVPGYSAGIFRRTIEDLNKPGSILDRARSWFSGTAARWEDKLHGFRFPSGATIHFGYVKTKQEAEDRYQGTEFQYVAFEELGQQIEEVYLYLFSRLRRRREIHVPLRMRSAGNPGGRGAEWIRRRFVEFAKHVGTGETVKDLVARRKRGDRNLQDPPYFVSPPSTQALDLARELGRKAQGAYFVPAYSEDNPGLDVGEYRSNLARLDPATRSQLDHGDWWAITGGKFFKPELFKFVDTAPTARLRVVRYWDLAATEATKGKNPDWTAGAKVSLVRTNTGNHEVYVHDVVRFREEPGEVEKRIRLTAQLDTKKVPIWIEEEPGSAGKSNTRNFANRVVFGWRLQGHRKTGPKPEYWRALSSIAGQGALFLVSGEWNGAFVQELCALTDDDSHPNDDQADAASGAFDRLLDDNGAARFVALANAR